MRNGRITEIPDELLAEVKQASDSLVTPEEVAVLFQGERRDVLSRAREVVWSESLRAAYRQMRMEDV